MSDDPNKKKSEGTGSSEHGGQQSGQKQGQQSGQHQGGSSESQKRPSQGGHESEDDRQENEKGGQRRAS